MGAAMHFGCGLCSVVNHLQLGSLLLPVWRGSSSLEGEYCLFVYDEKSRS